MCAADTKTHSTTLDRVRDLVPTISARAAETERARRLPLELVDALRDAGVFRMYVPARLGGDELSLRAGAEVIETLARADGSTAWVALIGAGWTTVLCYLPDTTYRTLYSGGPDLIVAGAAAPTGTATPVDGGYVIDGQWAFASGCHHADWLVATTFVADSAAGPDGMPENRIAVLRPDQCELLDTWHVSGLKGTGSTDFRVHDVFVPADWTAPFYGATPTVQHPADAVPALTRIALDHVGVALGIARGAIDDVLAIAPTRSPYGSPHTMDRDPVSQHEVGRLTAELGVLRAAFRDAIDELEDLVRTGGDFGLELRIRARQTAAHIADRAAAIVDRCYASCGTTGLRESNPLQRRLRDIRALTQHVSVSPTTFTTAGAFLLNQPVNSLLI